LEPCCHEKILAELNARCMKKRLPVIFINTHPIQYFAPLYKYLNEHETPTACWYCSDENVKGHFDRQFGSKVAWDIPLLEGYEYRFFKNHSFRPSLYNGFFGLVNLGMLKAMIRQPRSIFVVHGWSYASLILVIMLARVTGHLLCIRGESPLNQEMLKSGLNRFIKTVLLKNFLFRFAHFFFFIGEQNKRFYKYYGVRESKLLFAPYAVDNFRFQSAADTWKPRRLELRDGLGIRRDAKVILYTAKFIPKKRPLDLIQAFEKMEVPGKYLIMVGDGALKVELNDYVESRRLKNVLFPGFINQTEIAKYYALADVFVLCSDVGETWGLSVNEALNFEVPVVVSDMAGCAYDLVIPAKTGFISRMGDVSDLTSKIVDSLQIADRTSCRQLIAGYSYQRISIAFDELQDRISA
jgi:glycosyltransferase involved in cell wall biosynthesis